MGPFPCSAFSFLCKPSRKYIGQNKRKLGTRIREHKKSCEGGLSGILPDLNNNKGILFHFATTGHVFSFENTKILARERNTFRRKVIEGIHINNKKESSVYTYTIAGHKFINIWNPILKVLSL